MRPSVLAAARGLVSQVRDWVRRPENTVTCRERVAVAALFALSYVLVPFVFALFWVQVLSPALWVTLERATARPDGGAGTLTAAAGCVAIVGWSVMRAVRTCPFGSRREAAYQLDAPASRHHRACHEAAHAVAIVAMGGTVISVDIHCSGNQGGQCQAHLPDSMPVVDSLWAQMVHALAGNVIDLAGGHHDQGAQSDIGFAMEAAAGIISTGHRPAGYDGPLTFDGLLAGARAQARSILARNAEHVESIAARLVARPGSRLRTRHLPELHHVHRIPAAVSSSVEAFTVGEAPRA